MEALWHIFDACDDWYEHVFANGELQDGPALPAAECATCGRIAYWNVIPSACPDDLVDEIERLGEKGEAISLEDFRERANRWEGVLRHYGVDVTLRPGEVFQPTRWRIPSIPRYDVFWPLIGVVVSDRFRQLFSSHEVTGPTFHPVLLGPVGLAEPGEYPMIPKNLEFDDQYYSKMRCVREPSSCGEFFQVTFAPAIPSTEPGVVSVCDECGAINWDLVNAPQPERDVLRSEYALPRKYIPDADAFRSHVFDGFVIRDWVRKIIPDEFLLNCGVRELRVLD